MQLSSDKDFSQGATTSPFIKLPRELRDQIYHHLWSNTLLAFRHEQLIAIARYNVTPNFNILIAPPSWLLTNRQLYHEGMQQYYYGAHFTIGEHYALPLYEHRSTKAPASFTPYILGRKDAKPDRTISEISDISSQLFNLTSARSVRVEHIKVESAADYDSRRDCVDRRYGYCRFSRNGCCIPHLRISIMLNYNTFSHSFRDPDALLAILNNKDNALQELELCISPATPSLEAGLRQSLHWFLKAVPRDHLPEIRYDLTFLERLPNTLRRIRIGVVDDMHTLRQFPKSCMVALEELRRRCEQVVPTLVKLREENEEEEQRIEVKAWSYVKRDLPSYDGYGVITPPSWASSPMDHLCTWWEAVSPVYATRSSHGLEADSSTETTQTVSASISQWQFTRKRVSISRS